MKIENSQYITSAEAAKLLGYTIQHTRLLIRQNKFRGQKLGRDWLILQSDLENYLKHIRTSIATS
ncbi:MAG: helix-turn-helix domain-containing protein [Elusimicrobia bacterium]|nr:helix-turn-helix domain-containing protein [Elusimicrobiota bacterium]